MSDSNRRQITFTVPEDEVLVSYRYLLLMTLARFEKLHNQDSVPMQQDLLDGNIKECIEKIENYRDQASDLMDHLNHVIDLLNAEIPKKKARTKKK
jgi:hypothetical protein